MNIIQFEKHKNTGSLRQFSIFLILTVTLTIGCKNDNDFGKIIEFEYKDEFDGNDIIFRELLVYIQPGFLELLATSENEVNKNQRFVIRSKQRKIHTFITNLEILF